MHSKRDELHHLWLREPNGSALAHSSGNFTKLTARTWPFWNLNKTIQAHHEKVKNYTVRQDLKIRLMTIQYNLKFGGWVEKVNSEADTTKTTVYHMTLFQAPTNCMEDIFHLFYFTLVLENNTFICDNQSVAYRQKDQGFLFIFYCFPFVKKFEIRISQLV